MVVATLLTTRGHLLNGITFVSVTHDFSGVRAAAYRGGYFGACLVALSGRSRS